MSYSMIERVARALCEVNGDDPERPSGAFGIWWKAYEEEARAAIKAMRELPEKPGPRYSLGEYSRRTQKAWVADALSEPME